MADIVESAELSDAARAWVDYEGPENDQYQPAGRREIAMVRHAFFSGHESAAGTIESLREEVERLRGALVRISSPTQSTGLLWWQKEARQALYGQTYGIESMFRVDPRVPNDEIWIVHPDGRKEIFRTAALRD